MALLKKRYSLFGLLLWISVISIAREPFRQRADHSINAILIPAANTVSAHSTIRYTNNSPDVLDSLFIHLWPNAYSNYETPFARQLLENGRLDFHFTKRKNLGFIDSLNFSVDGIQAAYYLLRNQPDVAVVKLPSSLQPGQTIEIMTPFRVKLPRLVSRAGYKDDIYVISQWFPKVAVYDSSGWHPISYLEQGEFFSDFGKYEVSLTVPRDFALAATGLHSNTPSETSGEFSTYNISIDNIHDFCWVASEKLRLVKDKVILPSGKAVEIRIWCENTSVWQQHLSIIKITLQKMSEWVGEYPYPVCTVVEGPLTAGGGMEYPSLTVIDSKVGVGSTLDRIIAHEIIHNWFYGILASNEREEPWIDEGITSLYEDRVMMHRNGETALQRKPLVDVPNFIGRTLGADQVNQATLRKNISQFFSRINRQQPMNLHAEEYGYLQYGAIVYYKVSQALSGLEEYLGTEVFDSAMQELYSKKAFSHVNGHDVQQAFESASGRNLSWFFDGLLSARSDADYAVQKAEKADGQIMLTISNKSGIAAPIYAGPVGPRKAAYPVSDTTVVEPFSYGEKTVNIRWNGEKLVGIAPLNTSLDFKGCNNYIKTRGLFRKLEPIRFQWLAAPEDPRRTQIFFTPVMAGNKADKFMLGMALYNRVLPAKNIEWSFVPMYAFGSKQFTWIANLDYYGHPKSGKIREWNIGGHGKSFTLVPEPVAQQFFKAEGHAGILFRGRTERSKLEQRLMFRHVNVTEQTLLYSSATEYSDTSLNYWVNEIKYTLENKRALNPFDASGSIQHNLNWVKLSAEGRFRINLGPMKKYFSVRAFVGAFLYKNEDFRLRLNKRFAHTLSGSTGENDYLYDYTFLGRYFDEKLAGNQIALNEGQFKVIAQKQIIAPGQTYDWLMALNFRLDAPVKWLPFFLFADLGYSYDNHLSTSLPKKGFQYDLGLGLSVFNGAIEAYMPFAMSEDFRMYYKAEKPKFFSRITFSLNLQAINPHKIARTLLF